MLENQNADMRSRRGFAAMSPERQREIARLGGRSAHQQGVAHRWNSQEAVAAGRKGGRAGSREKRENQDGNGSLV